MKLKTTFFFLLLASFTYGQKTFQGKPSFPKLNYTIAYYGSMGTNPGLNAGLEYAFLEKVKTKSKIKRGNQRIKYKTKRLEAVPTIGFYIDPQGHAAVFEKLNLQYKKINNRRYTFNISVGAGYYNSFFSNVYDWQGNNAPEDSSLKVRGYFAPEFKMGLGRLKLSQNHLKGWFMNISSQFLFDYSNTVVPLPAIELGLRLK